MPIADPCRTFLDFAGGDGDKSLFSVPFLAQVTSEVWRAESGEERLSAKVLNGPCAGEAIHVASRTRETLAEQLSRRKLLSLLVYLGDDPSPVGMAAPELIQSGG
jgi:hypothetical protein